LPAPPRATGGGYPAAWIDLWHNQLNITAQYIAAQEVYVAVNRDNVLVGFYALEGAGDAYQLAHMWVEPHSLRTGVGRRMFRHALGRAAELGAKRIEIESDPHAEGFYHAMGAETVGEVTYQLHGVPRCLPLLVYTIGMRAERSGIW
jgi:predicted N-acetyltransferase YhbS